MLQRRAVKIDHRQKQKAIAVIVPSERCKQRMRRFIRLCCMQQWFGAHHIRAAISLENAKAATLRKWRRAHGEGSKPGAVVRPIRNSFGFRRS